MSGVYEIINQFRFINSKVVAEVDRIMSDDLAHGGNEDIYLCINQYILEIICCSMCTVLGNIALRKTD